jgi:hypothetical protein
LATEGQTPGNATIWSIVVAPIEVNEAFGGPMSSPSESSKRTPLDAAQKIVAELVGMTADHQSLALKFAIETLGLQLPVALASAPALSSYSAQPVQTAAASGAGHSSDIKSFTAMKAPGSDRQFAAVVAYFYQFEAKPDDRKESINAEIMKDAARLAGWPQVARWAMTLTNAKNAGYLDAVGSGKFRLSSVGENLVAITLPGDGSAIRGKGGNTNKKSKKRAPKKKSSK